MKPPIDHKPDIVFEAQYQKPLVGASLDPNHTHFIFVDDGSKKQFGKEQGLRGKFEGEVRKNGVTKDETEVPIVCLMVEGGIGTIDTVRNALFNGTPCIIIAGTGRAANVLSYAVEYSNKLDQEETISEEKRKRKLEKFIREKSKSYLKLDEAGLIKSVKWIMECLQNKKQIRIFHLDEEDGESAGDLDKAILKTLLEMGGLDVRTQLHLSLLWNRDDMAEEVIVKNRRSLKLKDLEYFLEQALVDNKLAFVKLLVERVSLASFLTKTKLEKLYNDTMQVSSDKYLLETLESSERNSQKNERTLEDIANALLSVSGIEYCPQLVQRDDLHANKNELKVSKIRTSSTEDATDEFKHPERELFVYSLLFSRHEMSAYFWEEMLCKTSGALFAVLLAKSMLRSSSVQVDINHQDSIEAMLKDYETKAVGVLNVCNSCNVKKSQTLLKVQHGSWGDKTCLEISEEADSKKFLSQSACQILIRDICFGKLSDQNPTWKIVLAAFMPVFVFAIAFKSELANEKKQLENTRKKAHDGEKSARSEGKGESFDKFVYRFWVEGKYLRTRYQRTENQE